MSEKVSVIIPIYNVEQYIDECIASACKQTYSNLEIILVDDGSTDTSGMKCDEWEEKDERIKVIHKINGGLSSARNAGLDIATGKYIYFLDGDDYIENTLFEQTVPYMNEPYDMVSFCYYEVYENGEQKRIYQPTYGSFIYNDNCERKKFINQILLKGKIGWDAWSRIYKRDIIEKYHLRFADNRIIFAEDLYFCLCYCSHAKKVVCINMALYYYRKRQDSIMGQQAVKLNVGRMNELGKEVLKHYLEYEDCADLVDVFPVIHFLIISNVMDRYQAQWKLPLNKLREQILLDLNDVEFFEKQMKNIKSYKKILYSAYTSHTQCEEMLNIVQYILDGKTLIANLRQRCIRVIAKMLQIIRK